MDEDCKNCKKCKWFEGTSMLSYKQHNINYSYDTGHCFKLYGHFPFDLQKALPIICKYYKLDIKYKLGE